MWLATWWYEDGLPALALPPWATVEVGQVLSEPAMGQPHVAHPRRVYRLLDGGVVVEQVDVAFLAAWDEVVQASVRLPAGSRRITIPGNREVARREALGPLLAAVVRAESPPATRVWFWCGDRDHAAAMDAGFGIVGRVTTDRAHRTILSADVAHERAAEGASLFGIPFGAQHDPLPPQ